MKKIKQSLISFVLILSFILLPSFDDRNDFEIIKNLDIYYTLFKEVDLYYVDEIDPGDLTKKAIDAMLKSLDPYTVYIPESRIEEYRTQTTGRYAGIGAVINKRKNKLLIAEIYKNSPADKAGLIPGDVILKIDGVDIRDKSFDDINNLIPGQPGTELHLLINRPDDEPTQKVVVRENIQMGSVPFSGLAAESIGYIKLDRFTPESSHEVKRAYLELIENEKIEKLILDLRGNPGGLLDQSVNIVNLFVPQKQLVVSMQGKVSQYNQRFYATRPPVDLEMPLVVLVNSRSASASEIVSGALQDLDRAVVVGQRTFGKGLVQITRPLTYNAQLKITAAKYYIPSGRCIQALDYSNRNPDGSVGKVPDSLITEFTTQNGRKIYDGGGIRPDIEIEEQKPSNITKSLLEKNLIFDYATQYFLKHPTITGPESFSITDEEYQNFVDFLAGKKYDYKTKREELLKDLEKIVKEERYYQIAEDEFKTLKKKLAHDKEKDLEIFKDEIKEILEEEIVSRYYYKQGRIKSAIGNDPEVKKAVEILNNPDSYNEILSVE